ncbi:hypothetical protein ACI2OX_17170 [Bacillus sp. N9]
MIGAWGMKGKEVVPLYAINIRQLTSALCFAIFIVPFIHGYPLVFQAATSNIVWMIVIAGLLGTANYSLYYTSINLIGAARGSRLIIRMFLGDINRNIIFRYVNKLTIYYRNDHCSIRICSCFY